MRKVVRIQIGFGVKKYDMFEIALLTLCFKKVVMDYANAVLKVSTLFPEICRDCPTSLSARCSQILQKRFFQIVQWLLLARPI